MAVDGEEGVARGKVAGGGYVFQRKEQLTMKVGNLPRGWERRVQKVGAMVTARIRFFLTAACAVLEFVCRALATASFAGTP